jgi:PAT family beta-lactamase induction signal transducer AmpG
MGVPTLFMIALHWAQEARREAREEAAEGEEPAKPVDSVL